MKATPVQEAFIADAERAYLMALMDKAAGTLKSREHITQKHEAGEMPPGIMVGYLHGIQDFEDTIVEGHITIRQKK